ncbi:MAG: hypothetical protein Fur0044_21350 [Anaerolineae bacterium]|nr:hypothetical protein [Anaerolineales bacterium]MCQ3972629.1 hypothetical protein [Anaerolineae bacterium]
MPKLIFEDKVPSGEEFQQALAQAMSNTNPVDDLLELSNELRDFEQKYHMSSIEFYEEYQAGSLSDELQHCIEWVATYEFFLKTKRQLEMALMRAAVQPALPELAP